METSQRLESALKKLYTAFHNNQLNPECCKQCAVGNIMDNTDSWKHFSDNHGAVYKNNKPNPKDKAILFEGLCAVITYLCELDGVSNVMDYTKMFEFTNDKPKHQIELSI